jgi:23S rRNA pseudouridine2605 synthase
VNGRIVTELGTRVDPQQDDIAVDGQQISKTVEKPVYLILNKPWGVLSTVSDDRGRPTVVDLIKDVAQRIYPVGRLDLNSEGLILLTNDGDLTKRLTHPRYEIEKEYRVLVTGNPSISTLDRWRAGGIPVEGRPAAGAGVEKLNDEGKDAWLKIVLTEGRKREIRTVAQTLGHPVKKLIRVRLGPVKLGRLKPGRWRYLSAREVQWLKQAVSR